MDVLVAAQSDISRFDAHNSEKLQKNHVSAVAPTTKGRTLLTNAQLVSSFLFLLCLILNIFQHPVLFLYFSFEVILLPFSIQRQQTE